MSATTALILVLLLGLYGLVITALAWVLAKVRFLKSSAVFLSFLTYGAATGALAVALWPMDTSVYPNFPAALLGDWTYVHAIEVFGDPHSAQAGYTVPWLLRVPQVHAAASVVLCGALGLVAQWLLNRRPTAAARARNGAQAAKNEASPGQ